LASSASSLGSRGQKVTQETHLCFIQRVLRSLASPSSLSYLPEPSSAGAQGTLVHSHNDRKLGPFYVSDDRKHSD
jgi:hypothetical protein